MNSPIEDARALHAQAVSSGQRRLLRLRGDAEWLREQAARIATDLQGKIQLSTLSGAHWVDGGRPKLARHELGGEIEGLIVDATEALDPDALGAVMGMVRGGGLVVWLEPSVPRSGLFEGHVRRALERTPGLVTHTQERGREVMKDVPLIEAVQQGVLRFGARTADQEHAVEQLLSLLHGNEAKVVLSAHRGRGKSSALGLFIAEALRRAPTLKIALASAHQSAREVVLSRMSVECRTRLQVVEPIDVVHGRVSADIVLVDEASALSVPILTGILARAKRVAFATTIHGYEGSGQGFRVRFWNELLRLYPKTREVWLEEPIRFRRGCPVESFIHEALLLDVGDPNVSAHAPRESVERGDDSIEAIDRTSLVENESLLRAVFGTFVLAHYRTTPSDLKHLLEDAGVFLWIARAGQAVVGALWAVEEGGLREEDARRVHEGLTRPRGHMLPEAFARHLGEPMAATDRGLRVVRIAVDARQRRRKTASRLLRKATQFASNSGLSYVGSGFAATRDVLAFWQANEMRVVHVGTKRGPASGEVSAIVLRGLNERFAALTETLATCCVHALPDLLRDGLRDLDPEVALAVLGAAQHHTTLAPEDEDRVRQYAMHSRPYDTVITSLHRFVHARALANDLPLEARERALLVAKILQGRPWTEIALLFDQESVAQAMRAVRHAIRRLL